MPFPSSPPLPNAIETSRSKYKNLTARFLKWLSCRAEDLKITSLDELDDPAEETSRGPAPKSRNKSGKSSRGRGKKALNQSAPQKSKLATEFTVGQLVKLAEKITQITNLYVPEAVFTVLEQIIDLRTEVGAFYSREQTSNPEVIESNHRHQHFINSLREIFRLLKLCPTSRPDNALVKLEQSMSLLGLEEDFNVPDSGAPAAAGLDEDWLPDNLKGKLPKKEKPATPMKDRPLSDFSLHADNNNAKDEAEMLAWMLFHDLACLRNHVRGLWEQYCREEISLVTASFLTTQTVELVKEIEEDFCRSHAHIFPGKNAQYLDLVKVMFHMSPSLDIRSVVQQLLAMDYPTVDFTMSRVFHALWQFGMTVKVNMVSTPRPGLLPTFYPGQDRASLDEEGLAAEDLAILMPHLAEVAAQCKFSSTDVGRKSDHTTVDEHALVQDMRHFLIDSTRPKPFHLIVQWAIYKDIVIVNRGNLKRPLNELHQIARHIVSSANGWLADYDRRYYTDNDVHSIRLEIETFKKDIETHVLTDSLGTLKSEYAMTNLAPFQLWHYNPWGCGAALFRILLTTHHTMVQVLNGTGYLGSVAQLYHGLRVHDRIRLPWPEMDKIVDIIKECTFHGHPPVRGMCAVSFNGFMGGDPALSQGRITVGYKSNGYGTGVLPKDFGGSLLGRLAEKHRYKLTNELVAELFPHAGDGVIAQRSRDGPSSRRLRFGGKRCDTLTFLTALKQRIEKELSETALSLDLFAVQRMSVSILRRWASRTKKEFTECWGPGYMERPTQICFLPGFLFAALEHPRHFCGKNMDSVERIAGEAVRAIEEGREDLRKSVEGGAKMFYFVTSNLGNGRSSGA